MTLSQKESVLRETLSIIPDVQERLGVLMQRATRRWGLPDEDKREELLVPGCVSRVWLAAEMRENVLSLRCDADSHLVLGLAGLLCEVYDGLEPVEALAGRSRILDDLGITGQLSPTRLRGLEKIEAAIHQFAAHHDTN